MFTNLPLNYPFNHKGDFYDNYSTITDNKIMAKVSKMFRRTLQQQFVNFVSIYLLISERKTSRTSSLNNLFTTNIC